MPCLLSQMSITKPYKLNLFRNTFRWFNVAADYIGVINHSTAFLSFVKLNDKLLFIFLLLIRRTENLL